MAPAYGFPSRKTCWMLARPDAGTIACAVSRPAGLFVPSASRQNRTWSVSILFGFRRAALIEIVPEREYAPCVLPFKQHLFPFGNNSLDLPALWP